MKHRPCKRLCSRLYLSYRCVKLALNPAKKSQRYPCPEREGSASAYAHGYAVFVLGVSMESVKITPPKKTSMIEVSISNEAYELRAVYHQSADVVCISVKNTWTPVQKMQIKRIEFYDFLMCLDAMKEDIEELLV